VERVTSDIEVINLLCVCTLRGAELKHNFVIILKTYIYLKI
jgi:hypothetical protein